MQLTNPSQVPVYTISGSNSARPLPEWLARRRKRSLKNDPEYANRVELLQDFEFEEASHCIRVSEDGEWVMSTGTYKPQIHTHYLPQLSLSWARHTSSLNTTFILLSSDYTKSLHLQSDRSLEFHTPGGCHYTTRLPRYGRDIVYDRQSTEALVPAVGVNQDGMGEVYRLNLESGRYMRSFEVDVGGDDFTSAGAGTLQGGINTGSVNTAAIAEQSHNLLAFGTSLGTVELWDPRAKGRAGVLLPPAQPAHVGLDNARSEITALDFNRSGMSLGTGSSNGLIHLYDLRSPVPYQMKDQGYGFAVHTLQFLEQSSATQAATMEPKLLSADKRIIKLWDIEDNMPWTSVEPAVDIKSVAWCKDSGMLLTANEGRQQHSFFVPQLGPAPKWCSFLDNLVEEMAEDPNDPNAFKATQSAAYPGYTMVNKDIIEGWKTKMIDSHIPPIDVDSYMKDGKMILENEGSWQMKTYLYEYHQSQFGQGESTRQNKVEQAIEKQRESRIRGKKKVDVMVNRRLAERMKLAEEKRERKHAKRLVESGGDSAMVDAPAVASSEGKDKGVVGDSRFAQLFEDQDFAVDETSREFQLLNPSTVPEAASAPARKERGLTAAEQEAVDDVPGSSSDDSDSDSEREKPVKSAASKKISSADYKRTKRPPPRMQVSSSNQANSTRDRSFGSRAQNMKSRQKPARRLGAVGEKEVSFNPAGKPKRTAPEVQYDKPDTSFKSKERRSASGNAFRKM
ncbi:unnamed protein product [Penicillium salamii]|uniref:NUC153 domain-containing protein n=1 Tax=Penicillium salamii TaxID=1612424 RepID=A0A9W4NHE8_9EURO|nr:unnamed protein product [Penicillium salamii]CAG8034600.1 unnamed protein product [Penicillium salamii]CAG8057020.1 unnamed protein product [Penicillium salamii]CAG8112439.1 unnamed protein product [Penicillium salamii]CAG8177211.1 unnamed protein product [Penicillium salamii]